MNATCPAGISQPQRVSDLGRLLDSEITARWTPRLPGVVHPPAWRLPLCMAPPPAWRLLLCMAPPSAWRLPLYKAPSSLARALCKAPSSLALALCKAPSPLAPALCKAPSPRHVRGGTSSDTRGSVCHLNQKPTSSKAWRSQRNAAFFLISLMRATSLNLKPDGARCASRSAQRDRRRALRVSFGTDDTRCVSPSVRRTKPHTNTPPTAHSQRPARHLHRDPSSSYYQRSASAHIATSPNATKLRRTAVRAARSRLLKAQLDTTRISSKRAPGRSATAAISVTAEITLDPWDHFYKNGITLVISLIIKVISEITFTKTHEGSQAFSAAFFRLA